MTASLPATALRDLDAALSEGVDRGVVAGVVGLLWRQGQRHLSVHGRLRAEAPAPMAADALFRIASMTKPLAGALALKLVDEGLMGLDEPVAPWLPELDGARVLRHPGAPLTDTVPAKRGITLRDLLAMMAGHGMAMGVDPCPYDEALYGAQVGPSGTPPPFPPEEVARRFGTLPLLHQPGEGWAYHCAYDLLSIVLARASGQAFDSLLQAQLLGPLGMRDTTFRLPADRLSRLAGVHQGAPGGGLVPYPEPADAAQGQAWPSGATGLVSSAEDFLRFAQMLVQGGLWEGQRLLRPESVALLHNNQVGADTQAAWPFFPGFWEDRGWGLGASPFTRPGPEGQPVDSYGWDGGFGTLWLNLPKEGAVALLLLQQVDGPQLQALHSAFWRHAMRALTA